MYEQAYEIDGVRFDVYSVKLDLEGPTLFFSMETPQRIYRDYFCELMRNTKNQLTQISKALGLNIRTPDGDLKQKSEVVTALKENLSFATKG